MMEERYTAAQFLELFERKGRIYVPKKKVKDKKKSDGLVVNNIRFRSGLEVQIAGDLAILKRTGMIQDWEYEPKFELPAETLTGRQKSHKVDFKVTLNSGEVFYLEGKGYRWRDGETRRQWVEDLYGITVYVVESREQASRIIAEKIG